jgi:GT2 family glycosyltransferase
VPVGTLQDLAIGQRASCSSVSIIIVTYNSGSTLPGLLNSLVEGLEGVQDFEIVVVDNDSADTSVDLALAHPIGARVIRMSRNAGYAAGINAATSTIPPERNFLILNPDIRLLPGSVRVLLKHLSDAGVGVAVPQILNEDGTLSLSLRQEPSVLTAWFDTLLGTKLAAKAGISEVVDNQVLYARGGSVEWATGAALMIAARTRAVVGDWDESFFLYSEEVEYLRRVREIGLSVVYVPSSKVVHIGGEYHDNPRLSALMTTNRIRYFRRYHGPVATVLFRLGIIVGAAMRFALGPGHRAALQAALTPLRSS